MNKISLTFLALSTLGLFFLPKMSLALDPMVTIKPHMKAIIDIEQIISMARKTSFENYQISNRSSGNNIYRSAVPSVAKLLTEDGVGSGVVVSSQNTGYILTNHHVVGDEPLVGVIFGFNQNPDDLVFGRVVKFDEISDLALVALNTLPTGLVPIRFSSNETLIGDNVHAIGHPLGEDWTYTRGYVSQKREKYSWMTDVGIHHVANVIQTQTPINPGNSGGPLLNDAGEFIGLNSFGNTSGEGINFALALSTINTFLEAPDSKTRLEIPSAFRNKLLYSTDTNSNGNPDTYFWDDNDNGVPDEVGEDFDEDGVINKIKYDDNENSIFELSIYWTTLEGQTVAIYEIDKNEDGNIDAKLVDLDLDGNPDRVL